MKTKLFHYIGILSALALIVACFLPWAYYRELNITFTGFNVTRFPSGVYYGRAGYPIAVLGFIVLIGFLLPKVWAKRVNLFLAAILLAYVIRTFILFTSGLMEGDVEKRAGIYLLLIASCIMMISTVFPYLPFENTAKSEAEIITPGENPEPVIPVDSHV